MDKTQFKPKGDYLAIYENNGLYKFCEICAHKMIGKKYQIMRHLLSQHGLKEGDFLKRDQQPTECKWINWEEYRANPGLELVEKDESKFNKGGRPWKNKLAPAYYLTKKLHAS